MLKKTFYSISILTLSKETTCNLHFFAKPYGRTSSVFCNQNKCAKTSLFSKKEKMLQDTICFAKRSSFTRCIGAQFSSKKNLKWLTFLPFETPTSLFLPKIGTILLYSSSFSMINAL